MNSVHHAVVVAACGHVAGWVGGKIIKGEKGTTTNCFFHRLHSALVL
jgi:hypothetical protein